MTIRYGWDEGFCDEPPEFHEDSDGAFVRYSDYEKLVGEIRDTILDFDHQRAGPWVARRLEKVLISLGEEI